MIRALLLVTLLAGCERRDTDLRASAPSPSLSPSPSPEATRAAEPAPASGDLSGTVVETMNASTYTYARLDRGGSELWVAGPQATLPVGTKLEKLEGTLMTDFYSKTLDRKFPQIYFVNAFGAGAAPVAKHAEPTTTTPPPAAADSVAGTVVETMDAAGYTYAQLDQHGTKVWVAGPTTKLAVGTKLAPMTASLMTAFHSNTLNRTFDQIYFVGSYTLAN